MIIESNTTEYELVRECLKERFPEIDVVIAISDPALKKLGFSDEVPCTFEIMATDDEIEEIFEFAMDLEAEVYMSENPEKDPLYQENKKWEMVYNILSYWA